MSSLVRAPAPPARADCMYRHVSEFLWSFIVVFIVVLARGQNLKLAW